MSIRRTNRPVLALAALSLAAALSGCGGGSGGGGGELASGTAPDADGTLLEDESGAQAVPGEATATSARRFGLVEIELPGEDADDGIVTATFVDFAVPRPHERLIADLLPPIDGCRVTRTAPSPGRDALEDAGEDEARRIGAGQTITLTSAEGTWLTLERDPLFEIEYVNERALILPLPSGLVLDVPGDDFPAFPAVPVRGVAAVTGSEAAGRTVAADERFRWTPSETPSAAEPVRIELFGVDEAGVVTDVDCLATDDGDFALPPAVRVELGTDFSARATLTRLGISAQRRGDALLLVTVESAAD